MTPWYVGKQVLSLQEFKDIPIGTVTEQYGKEYTKVGHNEWVSSFKGDPNYITMNAYDLSEDGSHRITYLPENEDRAESSPDAEPVKVKEEFVALYPNAEDDPRKETPRGDVLREAEHLITGDRNVSYGTPTENFKNIGTLWTTLLKHKLKPGEQITASDVGDLMVAQKLARNVAQRKRDSYTDMAGYAACAYEAWLDED